MVFKPDDLNVYHYVEGKRSIAANNTFINKWTLYFDDKRVFSFDLSSYRSNSFFPNELNDFRINDPEILIQFENDPLFTVKKGEDINFEYIDLMGNIGYDYLVRGLIVYIFYTRILYFFIETYIAEYQFPVYYSTKYYDERFPEEAEEFRTSDREEIKFLREVYDYIVEIKNKTDEYKFVEK